MNGLFCCLVVKFMKKCFCCCKFLFEFCNFFVVEFFVSSEVRDLFVDFLEGRNFDCDGFLSLFLDGIHGFRSEMSLQFSVGVNESDLFEVVHSFLRK